jgi:protein ImuA
MNATKEEIISKLRQDMLRWEGFRPPKTGVNNDLGLGPVATAFPEGVFPTGAIHEFISTCPKILLPPAALSPGWFKNC